MKKGFTAIELSIVLFIIILISLISIPLLINYQKTTKLKSESRVLTTNLRLAQQLAITEQNIYFLEIFPTLGNYRIINSKNNDIIKQVELDQEVSIDEITGLTDNKVQFIATGAVIESGSIALINSRKEKSTILIRPSGYVDITEN